MNIYLRRGREQRVLGGHPWVFRSDIEREDGAADGLLSGLGDPYTFYYTPEEYAKLWEDDEG